MKKVSIRILMDIVYKQRKKLGMTQAKLSEKTYINRTMLSRLEHGDYIPSLEQLERLSEALQFDPTSIFVEDNK